ncbi:type I secretion system permease/ATPase [Marinobacter sp. BSs20148]|uniref:type I secretion system permease/ATPase n=1 Tax=Marinobacter sp. BSs20148 TaxID=490759 RepID=UPI000277711B|nr:type I secretion system permease/ATPase [Marinobacter sp. BSs20148]AFP31427.1 Alkaline protease secretion ATP-binding protein AprD [Marinobacter sp. BSs20148]
MQDKNQVNLIREVFALCKRSFWFVVVFSFCINLLMIVPAIYMLQVYDRVITSGSYNTLLVLTLIMAFLMISMGGLEWVRSRVLIHLGERIDALLATRLFNAGFVNKLRAAPNSGSQGLQDLFGLKNFITGNGLFAFLDFPWLPVYLAIMFVFHPLYGWMGVGAALVLLALAFTNEYLTNPLLQDASKKSVGVHQLLTRNFQNAEAVHAMGMLGSVRGKWQPMHQEVQALQAQASKRSAALTSASRNLRMLVQSLILGLGGYLVLEQQISPGVMIAGSILLGRALSPIDQLIGAWRGFSAARSQYQRVTDLLNEVPEQPPRMNLPEPVGKLAFEQAFVVPPGSEVPVLKNLSFAINAGEVVAVIGPSASGKSSLARAALGVWPAAKGCVRLDSADITQWDREQLGPFVGYVPQDVELFDGFVKDNIARFGDVDADAVVEAAKLAGVHELILRLPQGYDTVIGQSGGVLSGGQRQRIALARALYKFPKLVVLDEPNSNLDDAGERDLARAIAELKRRGITVLVITHRMSLVSAVDKILVLVDGQVRDFDERAKVLEAMNQAARPAPVPVRKIARNPVPGASQ